MFAIAFLIAWGSNPPIERGGILQKSPSANEYYQLLQTLADARKVIPVAERKKKAELISSHMLETAQRLDYLSFSVSVKFFWCIKDSPRSRGPLQDWIHEDHGTIHVESTREAVATQVLKKGKVLYDYFLKDKVVCEFKHPYNGVHGQKTQYASDGKSVRLQDGVDDHLLICGLSHYLRTCVGQDAFSPKKKSDAIAARGEWIGRIKNADGESVDVVVDAPHDDDKNGQWYFYFVNESGFLVRQLNVRHIEEYKDFNRILWFMDYADYSTKKIAPETFSPSAELLQTTREWKEVPDTKGLASRDR